MKKTLIVLVGMMVLLGSLASQDWVASGRIEKGSHLQSWYIRHDVGWWKSLGEQARWQYVFMVKEGAFGMGYFLETMRGEDITLDKVMRQVYDESSLITFCERIDVAIDVLNIPDWVGMVNVIALVWDAPVVEMFGGARWEDKVRWWSLYPQYYFKAE